MPATKRAARAKAKQRVLVALHTRFDVRAAARAAGIHRCTVYRYLKRDRAFRTVYRTLLISHGYDDTVT